MQELRAIPGLTYTTAAGLIFHGILTESGFGAITRTINLFPEILRITGISPERAPKNSRKTRENSELQRLATILSRPRGCCDKIVAASGARRGRRRAWQTRQGAANE